MSPALRWSRSKPVETGRKRKIKPLGRRQVKAIIGQQMSILEAKLRKEMAVPCPPGRTARVSRSWRSTRERSHSGSDPVEVPVAPKDDARTKAQRLEAGP